ncbi:MAG: 50S ribosomal protein L11 methyltransferase [Alphaproteobacteria bacterium]|nr:50S ribosomal protein L11 methyltransferase [Alphaproteobacteria bacterium]
MTQHLDIETVICPKKDNWKVSILLPADAVPFFEPALDGDDVALLANEIEKGENKGLWNLEAIFQDKPDEAILSSKLEISAASAGIKLPNYKLELIKGRDWLRESLISFKPVSIGKYYIYGSHIKDEPPKDKIALKIDAATAFGSGEHFTTKGCLLGLEDISKFKTPNKILDMGCGSGILGLAAASTFHKPVISADIDPESVRVTLENSANNKLDQYIKASAGDGYHNDLVTQNGPYDLIFSNILANPLIMMAPDLAKNLNKDGLAILSGLLIEQEEDVLKAHYDQGLYLKKKYHFDEWSALIMGFTPDQIA